MANEITQCAILEGDLCIRPDLADKMACDKCKIAQMHEELEAERKIRRQGIETLRVVDILSAAEYIGCKIVDAFGNSLEDGKPLQDIQLLYNKSVEHIDVKDGIIRIFTFINFDKFCELSQKKEPKGLSVTTENMLVGNCPNCKKLVTSKHHKDKCDCGQMLQWPDEEK